MKPIHILSITEREELIQTPVEALVDIILTQQDNVLQLLQERQLLREELQILLKEIERRKANPNSDSCDSPKLSEQTFDADAPPIWELAARISAKVPDEEWAKVPPDLSQRFDYYQELRGDS